MFLLNAIPRIRSNSYQLTAYIVPTSLTDPAARKVMRTLCCYIRVVVEY